LAKVILKNISKDFGKLRVVKNVNVEIADGSFVVLVGPSGCGKTTTLRMVAGLEDISEGEIWIGDTLVNDVAPKNRDIAMVFQNYALYPHMNVYDNMGFGLKLRGFKKPEIKERVNEAAKILGIDDLLKRKPKQLSGGQRQRVAMGRAIVRKPKVFLFDEPLSNLDAKLRVQMRAELSKLHRKLGTTSVYVTHDQVEAMTLADQIVVMSDGYVKQVGHPMDVYNKPKNLFVAGFIGSPAMNFFSGEIIGESGKFYVRGQDIKLEVPEHFSTALKKGTVSEVVVGIRPEDIYPVERMTQVSTPHKIKIEVDVIELLGSEKQVFFNFQKNQMVARLPQDINARIGQPLELAIDRNKVHLFDKKTENLVGLSE
jgi:multiple sugar transport system ATP-binding protein